MNHEIPGHIAGYTEMNPHRPDPWDMSAASARAEIMREAARLAERDRIDQLARTIAERLMPEDEQEDAEPSYPPRTGGGACAGGLFALVVFVAFCAAGAWALFGPWMGGGRP